MESWTLVDSRMLGVVAEHLKPFPSTTEAGSTRQTILDVLHDRAAREAPLGK